MNQITIELSAQSGSYKRTMALTRLDEFIPTRVAISFVDLIDEMDNGDAFNFTAKCAYDESIKNINYRVCKVLRRL